MSDAVLGAVEGALNFIPIVGPAASIALRVADAVGVTGWLGQHILGTQGAKVADQVVAAAAAITGTKTPTAADVAGLPPDKAAELRIQLAKIAAEAQAAERNAELETMKAELADVSNARAQTIALASAGSKLAWAPVVISVIVLAAFGATILVVLTSALPAGSERVQDTLIGMLAMMTSAVVSYWVGSSSGSALKTQMLYNSTPTTPSPAPKPVRR